MIPTTDVGRFRLWFHFQPWRNQQVGAFLPRFTGIDWLRQAQSIQCIARKSKISAQRVRLVPSDRPLAIFSRSAAVQLARGCACCWTSWDEERPPERIQAALDRAKGNRGAP